MLKGIGTKVTDHGDVVLVCPWCEGDIEGNLVPGDVWDCVSCGAVGLFGPALS